MDSFFTKTNCDRCRQSLEGKTRTMSWFTEDCLCPDCKAKERHLQKKLKSEGIDTDSLEGCGYIPTAKGA